MYLREKAFGISRKQKQLLVVLKLISTATELRKEEPKNEPNGPLQVMDPIVSPPSAFSLTKSYNRL
jgi:hypothetical protein